MRALRHASKSERTRRSNVPLASRLLHAPNIQQQVAAGCHQQLHTQPLRAALGWLGAWRVCASSSCFSTGAALDTGYPMPCGIASSSALVSKPFYTRGSFSALAGAFTRQQVIASVGVIRTPRATVPRS